MVRHVAVDFSPTPIPATCSWCTWTPPWSASEQSKISEQNRRAEMFSSDGHPDGNRGQCSGRSTTKERRESKRHEGDILRESLQARRERIIRRIAVIKTVSVNHQKDSSTTVGIRPDHCRDDFFLKVLLRVCYGAFRRTSHLFTFPAQTQ